MPPRKKKVPRTFDEHLGNVIESKRKKRNLTVEELADAAGIKYQTMRRRLDGAPITTNELERISVVVGVSSALLIEEALADFGGMDKLLAEYATSDPSPTVEDNVTYLGHVTPPLADAADDKGPTPSRD